MRKILALGLTAAFLAGCSTTQQSFYKNPKAPNDTSLCRVLTEQGDETFRRDVATELVSRGVTAEDCQNKINAQTAAIAGVAIVGAAIAIGASGGGYGGGGYSYPNTYDVAWDQFFDSRYRLIWRCRSTVSGQFVFDQYCASKLRSDHTWPGWSA